MDCQKQQHQGKEQEDDDDGQIFESRSVGNWIKGNAMNVGFNVSYKWRGGLNWIKHFSKGRDQGNRNIYIFGNQIKNYHEALQEIRNIVWFSYRNISYLSKEYHSDTGWGCLIRVGQMILATVFKRFLHEIPNKMQRIIESFLQFNGELEKYSIRKFVEQAKVKYQLNYGSWFKKSQICKIIQHLHKNNPMKGTQNIEISYFFDGKINMSQIANKLNKKLSQEIYEKQQDSLINYTIKKAQQKAVVVFVSFKIGDKKVETEKYNQFLKLLKECKCGMGAIGGVPRKGLYFVGCQEDEIIYLDPHFVQQQVNSSNLKKQMKTFECTQLRKLKKQQIINHLTFVFYINSQQNLQELIQIGKSLQQNYQQPVLSVFLEQDCQ